MPKQLTLGGIGVRKPKLADVQLDGLCNIVKDYSGIDKLGAELRIES